MTRKPPTIRIPRAFLDDRRALSLLGHWYALGPEGVPFVPGDPDFNVHRIVEDDPAQPDVLVENDGGQRFILGREFARDIAIPPIRF